MISIKQIKQLLKLNLIKQFVIYINNDDEINECIEFLKNNKFIWHSYIQNPQIPQDIKSIILTYKKLRGFTSKRFFIQYSQEKIKNKYSSTFQNVKNQKSKFVDELFECIL